MVRFLWVDTKPWLKRDFKDGTNFSIKVNYIIRHLGPFTKKKVRKHLGHNFEKWQNNKEKKIILALDKGVNPNGFDPIFVGIHPTKKEFEIEDGVSRLRAFKSKGIKRINVKLRVLEL